MWSPVYISCNTVWYEIWSIICQGLIVLKNTLWYSVIPESNLLFWHSNSPCLINSWANLIGACDLLELERLYQQLHKLLVEDVWLHIAIFSEICAICSWSGVWQANIGCCHYSLTEWRQLFRSHSAGHAYGLHSNYLPTTHNRYNACDNENNRQNNYLPFLTYS